LFFIGLADLKAGLSGFELRLYHQAALRNMEFEKIKKYHVDSFHF